MLRKLPEILLLSVSAWASAAGTAVAGVPNVVVSIKPIHSLAAGVMNGIGEPALLIEGGASPHSYTLKPSEAASLQNADVVLWVGDELETFLEKPLQTLPRQARVVALHETPGVHLLGSRGGGAWEIHGQEHEAEQARRHGAMNMHIWLDPTNAQAMVSAIAETLAAADPDNADRYRSNADALITRLTALDRDLRDTLTPVRNRPYVVFHDAYPYFERRYGLTPVGSITVDPERKPGARRVGEIRAKIKETGAVCVFSEPQFESAIVNTLIEGAKAKTAILDPLGADIKPGPDAYFQLMRALAVSARDCLAG